MRILKFLIVVFLILSNTNSIFAQKDEGSSFQAGAAKIDITPRVKDLPASIQSIHDKLFIRALVIDDGQTSSARVSIDDASGTPFRC